MSGSGSSYGGGGWSGDDECVDCASLFETTIINSPDPDVISKLTVNDNLAVTLDAKRILKVVTDSNEIAGSITSARMLQIIDCIEQGFSYIAIVKSISGGRVEIEIRPEST